ncbi:MAG: TIGR03936 family radical SAM-associated protein [Acidimicrobiales bacterium]
MRLRLRFTKRGKIRFTSHRDTARVWERTVRRAQLPIAYSQGFSPHAKLSFGLALSTGFESDAEYLDIELDAARADQVEIDALPPMLSALLPDGMEATAIAVLPPGAPSLQQIVTSCEYLIDLAIDEFSAVPGTAPLDERVALAVARVNAAESVIVSRERKGVVGTDDIRPAILALHYEGPSEHEGASGLLSGGQGPSGLLSGGPGMVRLRAELAAQPKAVRPSELLAAIAVDAVARVRRTHQWIELEGLRSEPLLADQYGGVAGTEAASSAGTFAAAGAVMGRFSPDHHAGTTALATVPAVREEFFDVRSRGPRLDGLRQTS